MMTALSFSQPKVQDFFLEGSLACGGNLARVAGVRGMGEMEGEGEAIKLYSHALSLFSLLPFPTSLPSPTS